MKRQTLLKAVLCCSLAILIMSTAQIQAQQPRPRRGGLYGDWQLKVQFGERQMEPILSFSRDNEGNLKASWISLFGVVELKDVKFEENKLTFVQTVQFGDNEFTSDFTGTVEEDKLTGVLSSDRGESKVEGKRSPRMPRAVGTWEMKFKVGERDITTKLVVKLDKEGKLIGEWLSQWGEHEITDIAYERGTLTFKRKSKMQDREWESTFDGRITDDTLTGVIKSEMGDIEAEGKRIGAAAIGTWNLEIETEWGKIKQRLNINPNMSALYGPTLIKKIDLDGDKVSFKYSMQFGDQEFESSFEGKIAENKLTGEMTTSRGTQKITGTKVIREPRRRNNM
ncbi:MAG: hypothetical protein JW837_02630 [Sedimentisphaerales bacterium]|nr:hypothetical protein [Sedimentisphaerales bacterium]